MYKIYPDGREELVRGGQLAGVSAPIFKDVIKAGNSNYILNLLQYPAGNVFSRNNTKQVSVIGQSLLFEDAEVKVSDKNYKKPPTLANPLQ
jgi:hypothetical protein